MENQRLSDILHTFYQISGMEISVTDRNLHPLAGFRYQGDSFCSLIHKSAGCLECCRTSDRNNITALEERKSGHICLCPFGITEAFIPLCSEEEITGYALCSMGIVNEGDSDEKAIDGITEKAREYIPELSRESVGVSLECFRRLTKTQAEAYFNMLKILAEYIELKGLLPTKKPTLGELTKEYVRNNLSGKLTLPVISWNLHCSTVTLTQHFKAEYGYSVMSYVKRKRMSKAKKLLISTDKPLHEIADMCGYPDVEYFSRSFKKEFGEAPGNWRKKQERERNGIIAQ